MGLQRKKQKRRPIMRVVRSLVTVVVICGVLGVAAGFYSRSVFESPGPLTENRTFTVERGMRTPAIAHALADAGIISDPNVFIAAAYATQAYKRMRAGEYLFEKNATMATVMSMIVLGKELIYKISVPEGWTSSQVIERVNAHQNLEGTLNILPLEGTLLPDTYVFRSGMTRDDIVRQMRAAQEKLVDDLWQHRVPGLPFKTKEEAITLASIVERETAVPEERPRIASVFINRLRNRMRLQSDPTIIYGISGGKSKLDRPITRSDLETKNPYNTYRIDGLPPTPIGNPGRDSIAAVLNPLETKDLYFVADGSGGHVFSSTLAEHSKNVGKWRVIEKDLKEKAEAGGKAEASPEGSAVEALAEASETAPPEGQVAVPEPAGDAASAAEPKPGAVLRVSGELIPIPMQSPRKK